jgi:hypothetical protein
MPAADRYAFRQIQLYDGRKLARVQHQRIPVLLTLTSSKWDSIEPTVAPSIANKFAAGSSITDLLAFAIRLRKPM